MPSDRPTLDTVAQAAGVSRMTVSNAYNRPDQLSASTREHVLQVAARLGYAGPDPAGRSLRRRRVDTIGVLLTERLPTAFTDPGLVSLMRGLSTELGAAGPGRAAGPRRGRPRRVVGAQRAGRRLRRLLHGTDRPGGHVGASPDASRWSRSERPHLRGVPWVGTDNTAAGAMAGTHLAELGHRRLGIVALPGRDAASPDDVAVPVRWGSRDRIAGFAAAAVAVGVRPDRRRPSRTRPPTPCRGAGRGARDPRPSRPAAADRGLRRDRRARPRRHGGRRRCRSARPRDLSVVGFDDIPEAAPADPGLTTVSHSLFEQGQAAAPSPGPAARRRAAPAGRPGSPPRLVVRSSTAPPRRVSGVAPRAPEGDDRPGQYRAARAAPTPARRAGPAGR